jgi:hypothetical protein
VAAVTYNLVPNPYNRVHYFERSQLGVCQLLARYSAPQAVVLCPDADALAVALLGGRRCYAALPSYVIAQCLDPRELLAYRDAVLRGEHRAGGILRDGSVHYVLLPRVREAALAGYLRLEGCSLIYEDPGYVLYSTPAAREAGL